MAWTADQVLSLAPDDRAAQAGRGQSSPVRWSELGQDDRALWGLCQGSGAKPYQTAVDLAEPAFSCSCPSRKFPCKHGLGLMLLWADSSDALPAGEAPGWASEWLAGRDQRASKRAAPQPGGEASDETVAKAKATAEKRIQQREKRIAAGLDELELWLGDLVRQGLAQAEQHPRSYFEEAAKRLVDAQAPGLARRVRRLGEVVGSGDGWPDKALAEAGLLHLLIGAYRRHDDLHPALRAEVRAQLGWASSQEDVLSGEPFGDRWNVVGQSVRDEDRLRVRRTWLWGTDSHRWALLMDFAAGMQPLPPMSTPGRAITAELAFYPAAWPLRALIARQEAVADIADGLPALPTVTAAYEHRARALASSPFADRVPVALTGTVVCHAGRWHMADEAGAALELHPTFASGGYVLLALSGGRPVQVFGEWLADGLLPLSASAGDELWPL